ncbi:MAG: metallophosphoesterase [Intestinibaculum porci]|uniref:metallophosphoesterase n=1 Tax=Intestinibaculum porci TaxID=2487118 RepID=UPI0024094790|nr:metallophosphoesterase [Intestinibaculum porci]MDD6421708.1 metallophosphoesterase [Intestinibaculum porci]
MNSTKKKIMAFSLVTAICGSAMSLSFASPAPDGKTDANVLANTTNTNAEWTAFQKKWGSLKSDWTQISLAPGSTPSSLNFAWYTKTGFKPSLKIGEGENMAHAKTYNARQSEVKDEKDQNGDTYNANKVTARGLKEGTTYYYTYQKDENTWSDPAAYTPAAKDSYNFLFVGDPQVGSSNELKGSDSKEFYDAQSNAVMNDAFNWNNTLNKANQMTDGKIAFIMSAGDQIQTTKKKAPGKKASISEIEYTGFLSPGLLKNIPLASTVGNHDADNPNYTYHFNPANMSTLGTNNVTGGDYYFTYGDVLYLDLNAQNSNVAEHETFIKQAIAKNPSAKWKIAIVHQDIYGSAEHSNEPDITNLRYQLVPYFEENGIDLVLSGHDHAYSRTKILKGGHSSDDYDQNDFEDELKKDLDAGDQPAARTVAPENIKEDSTDPKDQAYLTYLKSVFDEDAIQNIDAKSDTVINPDGIMYVTAGSSSGSKYYDLVPRQQSYIANRWQEDVPTYSVISVNDDALTINTYRSDTNEKIDTSFTISKGKEDLAQLKSTIDSASQELTGDYTKDSIAQLQTAIDQAKTLDTKKNLTKTDFANAIKSVTDAKNALVKNVHEAPKAEAPKTETKSTTAQASAQTTPAAQSTAPATAPVAYAKGSAKVKLSKVKVSKIKAKVYTGKALKPTVKLTYKNKALQLNKDYKVTYKNNKKVGTATITIKGIGKYTGTKKVTFKITPAKAVISKASKTKTGLTLKLKALKQVSGYVVTYSSDKAMKKSKSVTTKKTSLTIKASAKTTYVKVKAYKLVNGKKVYGSSSSVKGY